jgi:hypothetical protein
MDEWDTTPPKEGSLGKLASLKHATDPEYPAFGLANRLCEGCKDSKSEGRTYLRAGRIASLCDVHVQSGNLRLALQEIRTEPLSEHVVSDGRGRRTTELHDKGFSTRKIGNELELSQGACNTTWRTPE